MKNRPRPRQRTNQRTSKVPLTFYRSAEPVKEAGSPFEKTQPPPPSRLQSFLGRLIDVALILVILVVVIYGLIVTPHPKVIINSKAYHPAFAYARVVQKDFNSFKNRNKITLDEQSIVRELQSKFPEISSAEIELPILSQTPTVRINIATPALILQNGSSSFVVDSDGVAAYGTNEFSGGMAGLPVVTDQSGFSDQAGRQALSANSVNFIVNLVAQLHHANVPVKSLILPQAAEELDLRTSDKPYYVKFYLGGDALKQTGQFLAARHNFDSSGSQPSQYLDVRVDGRIFYK